MRISTTCRPRRRSGAQRSLDAVCGEGRVLGAPPAIVPISVVLIGQRWCCWYIILVVVVVVAVAVAVAAVFGVVFEDGGWVALVIARKVHSSPSFLYICIYSCIYIYVYVYPFMEMQMQVHMQKPPVSPR